MREYFEEPRVATHEIGNSNEPNEPIIFVIGHAAIILKEKEQQQQKHKNNLNNTEQQLFADSDN